MKYQLGDERAPTVAYAYYPAGEEMVRVARSHLGSLQELLAGGQRGGDFFAGVAEAWWELNVAHPFREGNTRTQIVFFSQYLSKAGFTLDAPSLSPTGGLRGEFVAARFFAQATGSSSRLEKLLARVCRPDS